MRGLPILLLMACLAAAQSAAPQRTMTASPPGTRPVSGAAPASGAETQETALAKYREMWSKMGPAQQKAFVAAGGYTPEQYERMLNQKSGARAPSGGDPRGAIDPTMDSLTRSLQDLNAIRDANLDRVQKGGCPPEVASRIADLKGQLQSYEAAINGGERPGAAAPARSGTNDPLALAGDWYKRSAEQPPAPRDSRESKLLDDVLGGAKPPADSKSPEAEKKRKAAEQEIARIQAEIAQLSGACAAPSK